MLGFLLTLLIISAVSYAVSAGDTQAVSEAALEGGDKAVQLCITLCSAMALWGGIMNIAEKCGVTRVVTSIIKHPLRVLFRDADKSVTDQIALNVTANLAGLGNAAFPTGLRAMKLMSSGRVSERSRVFFVVLNTASIQLIPLTVSRLRVVNGAADIWDCAIPTVIVSAGALSVGLLTAAVICPKECTVEQSCFSDKE